MVAPSAPALAAPYPISLRRVILPLYQASCAHFSSFQSSDIASPPFLLVNATIGSARPKTVHASVLAATIAQENPSQQAALDAAIEQFRARTGVDRIFLHPIKRLQDRWWAVPQPNRTPVCLDRRQFDRREPPNGTQQIWRFQCQSAMLMRPRLEVIPMPRHKTYVPHGVIPAVLLPFDAELAIDEAGFRKHLRDVAATPGITAITVNAHSTEVASCSFEEQRRVLAIAQDEIGGRLPLVNGIWADGSLEAARIARMATERVASALRVFPPAQLT